MGWDCKPTSLPELYQPLPFLPSNAQDGGRGPVWHMKRAVWVGTLIITVF